MVTVFCKNFGFFDKPIKIIEERKIGVCLKLRLFIQIRKNGAALKTEVLQAALIKNQFFGGSYGFIMGMS